MHLIESHILFAAQLLCMFIQSHNLWLKITLKIREVLYLKKLGNT